MEGTPIHKYIFNGIEGMILMFITEKELVRNYAEFKVNKYFYNFNNFENG